MKFLQKILMPQIIQEQPIRLTDTQQSVLVSVYAAATPELAYDQTVGAENIVHASTGLQKAELINIDQSTKRAGVTDAGQQMLFDINYIDDIGELTEIGRQALDRYHDIKHDFITATESFKILKSIM